VNIRTGKVIEVAAGKDEEGSNVEVHVQNGSTQQKWKIRYVDTVKAGPTEGLDGDWGFHRNRPFYIRSKMPSGRTLEVVGSNLVLKTILKWRKPQMFIFDGVSKTIKSEQYPEKSLDIAKSGKSRNLQLWKTNARWF
jgi:hypothetical protein